MMDKFTVMPESVSHNKHPVFHARWVSGETKEIPQDSQISFCYEGHGEEDGILIDNIQWQGAKINQDQFNSLMDEAITAIDHWIAARL